MMYLSFVCLDIKATEISSNNKIIYPILQTSKFEDASFEFPSSVESPGVLFVLF